MQDYIAKVKVTFEGEIPISAKNYDQALTIADGLLDEKLSLNDIEPSNEPIEIEVMEVV